MNVLITGATGMFGSVLAETLNDSFNVYMTGRTQNNPHIQQNFKSFDLKNESYEELIEWSCPNIIIHCAAIIDGNYCNTKPLEAIKVNGISVKKLIDATTSDVKIIYISSDAVFPSDSHLSKETDQVSPENVYGKSKEFGEFFLKQSGRDYTIIRTTIVGGRINKKANSFVEWIVNSVIQQKEITLFDDVIFTPISIWDLAVEINDVIIPNKVRGIYHITGSEISSKFEFGIKLITELGLGVKYIKKGSIKDFSARAGRSNDQTLSIDKYKSEFNRELPSIVRTIKRIKCEYEAN